MSKELKVVNEAEQITPMSLVQMAVEQNADLDKLERLMVMQEKWEANEARKAYNKAIAKFRSECPTIEKNKEVDYTGQKGRTHYKHADLAGALSQIQPLMSECGLSHSWKSTQSEGLMTITCTITHVMGHSESTTMSGPYDPSGGKNSIQAIGSATTYLQRYSLFSILGLAAAENDDDGNGVDVLDTKAVIELLESAKTLAELDSRATHALNLDKQGKVDARKVYMQRKNELKGDGK